MESTAEYSTALIVNVNGEVLSINENGQSYLVSPAGENFAFDVGASHAIWAVTTEPNAMGSHIAKLTDGGLKSWTVRPGPAGGVRLAAGPNGAAYLVNAAGEVWIMNLGESRLLSPQSVNFASDVGIGLNGNLWIVTPHPEPGGQTLKYATDITTSSWATVAHGAAATRIAVANDGSAYVVNQSGEVRRVTKNGDTTILSEDGFAFDIGIGSMNIPWVVTSEPRKGGSAIAFNKTGKIDGWTVMPPPAAAVAISVKY